MRQAYSSESDGDEEGKLPDSFPPLTHLCIGMVLAQAQQSILFPQEWDYIRDHQVSEDSLVCDCACSSLSSNACDMFSG